MRTAIYARYSSDHQSEASIEDQVRQCRARIEQEGWSLTEIYSDAAISGATVLRPGYQKMLGDVRNGAFDIVVAEALDRLSRDQENIAGLYKQQGLKTRAASMYRKILELKPEDKEAAEALAELDTKKEEPPPEDGGGGFLKKIFRR